MCEIPCDVDECVNNTDGICGEPGSISMSGYDAACAHELPEEIIYCLSSGLSVDECLDCEGDCKTEGED